MTVGPRLGEAFPDRPSDAAYLDTDGDNESLFYRRLP